VDFKHAILKNSDIVVKHRNLESKLHFAWVDRRKRSEDLNTKLDSIDQGIEVTENQITKMTNTQSQNQKIAESQSNNSLKVNRNNRLPQTQTQRRNNLANTRNTRTTKPETRQDMIDSDAEADQLVS